MSPVKKQYHAVDNKVFDFEQIDLKMCFGNQSRLEHFETCHNKRTMKLSNVEIKWQLYKSQCYFLHVAQMKYSVELARITLC